MKKLLLIIVCFLFYFDAEVKAQVNLVPNPGFEILTGCDSMQIGWGHAPPWDAPSGNPELFNPCSTIALCNVPFNFFGFQYPHSGDGYAGLEFFQSCGTFREYLQVKLDSNLVSQHKYCVTYYVSLSNNYALASNNLGIYFSSTHTFFPGTSSLINLTPQILESTIITDTTNWTLISGEYIASGGEQYIIIGNFNIDTTVSTLSVGGGLDSYYYIDDVSIIDCTGSGIGINEISEQQSIEIYPNPATSTITIETKNSTIKNIHIYNVLGSEMLNQVQHNGSTTIDVSSFAKGIYFVEAETSNGIIRKKFIKQ